MELVEQTNQMELVEQIETDQTVLMYWAVQVEQVENADPFLKPYFCSQSLLKFSSFCFGEAECGGFHL